MPICYEAGPPWYRQPNEPDDAYEAFCEYRDQEHPRSARLVTTAGLSMQRRLDWFQLWDWGERVALWDAHINLITSAERGAFLKEATRDIAAKHMALLSDARALAAREIQKMLADSKKSELTTLKPRDLIRLLTELVKLERLVRGESTSNESLELNTDNLSDDDLRTWQGMIDKAKNADTEEEHEGGEGNTAH